MADKNKIDFEPIDFEPSEPAKDAIAFEPSEPTRAVSQEQKPGLSVDSFIRPLAQGLSYGTADEATGAVSALKNALSSGNLSLDNLKQEYEIERDRQRALNAEEKEKNPALYSGLELGSGILAPGGALLKVAKNAPLLAKLGATAATGAGFGALGGAGYSEGENVEEVAKDAAIGGALGGVLPAGLLGVGTGAAKVAAEFSPIFNKAAKGLARGFEGVLPQNIKLTENIKKLVGRVGEESKDISATYEALLNEAQKEGRQISTDKLAELASEIETRYGNVKSPEIKSDVSKVLEEISSYAGKEADNVISPRDAQLLKSSLGDKQGFQSPLLTTEGKKIAGEFKSALADVISSEEGIPGLKPNDERFKTLLNVLDKLGVKKENLFTLDPLTNLPTEVNPKAIQAVQALFGRAASEKASSGPAMEKLNLLGQGLGKLGIDDPIKSLLEKTRQAKDVEGAQAKFGSYVGYGLQKGLQDPKLAKGIASASDTGNVFKKDPVNSYDVSEQVKNSSPEEKMMYANQAAQIPGLENQSEKLKQAVEAKDLQTTNKILFDLLQRSSFRNRIR